MKFRIEKDILGEIEVPSDAYWGINTQRAIKNFQISGKKFPEIFIRSLAQVKKACLLANIELGLIESYSKFIFLDKVLLPYSIIPAKSVYMTLISSSDNSEPFWMIMR